MLCCHDTWYDLKLTTLKPSVNQQIYFSYGNVLLSYVNEAMHLFGNLPFFRVHVDSFMAGDG